MLRAENFQQNAECAVRATMDAQAIETLAQSSSIPDSVVHPTSKNLVPSLKLRFPKLSWHCSCNVEHAESGEKSEFAIKEDSLFT